MFDVNALLNDAADMGAEDRVGLRRSIFSLIRVKLEEAYSAHQRGDEDLVERLLDEAEELGQQVSILSRLAP